MRVEPNIREITTVLEMVETETGITAEQMYKARRYGEVVLARIAVAKRLRALGYSLTQIGTVLNKDHTSVIYYLKQPVPKRYKLPYAGSDFREYRWKVRPYAGA